MGSLMGSHHLTSMSRVEREAFLLGATTLFDEAMCSLQPEVSIMLKEWLDDLAEWQNGPAPLPPSQWSADQPVDAPLLSANDMRDAGLRMSDHLAQHCDQYVAAAMARDAAAGPAPDDRHAQGHPVQPMSS